MKNSIITSTQNRIATSEKLFPNEIPLKLNYFLKNDVNSIDTTRKFCYDGGEKLVNYGLNSFVRDIYINSKATHAIYSDRFGNYFLIENEKVRHHINNSSLCISPEGVLIFYSKDILDDYTLYVTLNCKFGLIFNLSSIIGESTSDSLINIFTANGKTYIELSICKLYYLLDFSFNLYSPYGSQLEVKAYKLNDTITKKDIMSGKIEVPFETVKIKKQNKSIEIISNFKEVTPKSFKTEYKDYFSFSIREKIESIYCNSFLCNGDEKVDDCINSFLKTIDFYNISTKIYSLCNIQSVKYPLIVQYDRYYDKYINTDISFQKITKLSNSKMYVSSEGVIIAINKNIIFISLDGIIWKSYDISIFLDDNLSYDSIKFIVKNYTNYLTFYKGNNIIKKYVINFTFNFWDLYKSPVEIIIE